MKRDGRKPSQQFTKPPKHQQWSLDQRSLASSSRLFSTWNIWSETFPCRECRVGPHAAVTTTTTLWVEPSRTWIWLPTRLWNCNFLWIKIYSSSGPHSISPRLISRCCRPCRPTLMVPHPFFLARRQRLMQLMQLMQPMQRMQRPRRRRRRRARKRQLSTAAGANPSSAPASAVALPIYSDIWRFPKMGVPQNGWFIMNIKWKILLKPPENCGVR